jgi:hypothetical protein
VRQVVQERQIGGTRVVISAAWLSGSQRRRFPFGKLLAEIAIASALLAVDVRFGRSLAFDPLDSIHRAA